MINIKIIEGDFSKKSSLCFHELGKYFSYKREGDIFKAENIPLSSVLTIELMSEEKLKKVSSALGWAVAGGVLTGGIGAIAGLVLGGNKNLATYLLEFKDGRKALCQSKNSDFTKLKFIADNRKVETVETKGKILESKDNNLDESLNIPKEEMKKINTEQVNLSMTAQPQIKPIDKPNFWLDFLQCFIGTIFIMFSLVSFAQPIKGIFSGILFLACAGLTFPASRKAWYKKIERERDVKSSDRTSIIVIIILFIVAFIILS